MRNTFGLKASVGRWTSPISAPVASGRRRLGVTASRLARAIQKTQLYRVVRANGLTRAIGVLLTVAILVSALYPLLQRATPHTSAASFNRTHIGQVYGLSNSALTAPLDVCQLYSIALHTASPAGGAVGGTIPNIYNSTSPCNFGGG